MTVVFTAANNAVSAAPLDLITSALKEINAVASGEDVPSDEAADCLEKLQRLIDSFNAQQSVIYNVDFALYNLTANHGPHTIGPAGDFNVPIRPVKVVSASFVLNGGTSNPVDCPIYIRDDDWWAANPLKSLTSSVVTDLYYSPSTPLGNLNFYPIANVAAPVRLETWSALPQAINLTTHLGFPAGYWDAIVLSLALRLCPMYEKQPSPVLVAMQREAMQIIRANNDPPPRIDTNSGMPSSGGSGRPDFNFLTGMRE